jgi:hypothetical protein
MAFSSPNALFAPSRENVAFLGVPESGFWCSQDEWRVLSSIWGFREHMWQSSAKALEASLCCCLSQGGRNFTGTPIEEFRPSVLINSK